MDAGPRSSAEARCDEAFEPRGVHPELDLEQSRIIDERIAAMQFNGESTATDEVEEAGTSDDRDAVPPEWSESATSPLMDFIAYQAIDYIDACILGPCSLDGVHDDESPKHRPHE